MVRKRVAEFGRGSFVKRSLALTRSYDLEQGHIAGTTSRALKNLDFGHMPLEVIDAERDNREPRTTGRD